MIEVVGADANNLREIDVDFPVGAISMVVGVSGSGKSSLLEHTLAREGAQRLETYLGVAQRHLGEPEGRAFVGRLPATIHVGQRAFRASVRTTVGTASGLLSLLRRMFIRWSAPVSTVTGESVGRPSAASYANWIHTHHQGPTVIWAIPVSMAATDGRRVAARLLALGLDEVIVRSETDSPEQWARGRALSLTNFRGLNPSVRHLIEVKVGALEEPDPAQLLELLERAFDAGEGRVFVELPGSQAPALAGPDGPALDSRRHWIVPDDPEIYAAPDQHLLSFNAPEHQASGACPACRGLGRTVTLDLDALVVEPDRSLHAGAFSLWTTKNYKYVNIQHETLEGLRGIRGFDPDVAWSKLPAAARRLILDGSGSEKIVDREPGSRRKLSSPRTFEGFRAAILHRVERGSKTAERLAHLVGEGPCPACDGTRWSPAARALRLGGVSIDELLRLNFDQLASTSAAGSELRNQLPKDVQNAASSYFDQIHQLTASFVGAGLGHLSPDRTLVDVSEGESRRLRLAAVFDGRHHGLCLLLDEPARGLHDEDVERLARTLRSLRGPHTLILNEHRRRLARAADQLIELGPGPGPHGGLVTSSGPVPKTWWTENSGLVREPLPISPRSPQLKIKGCRVNNLEGITVDVPLGRFVCVTGVSGSGKSSFVRGVLVPALSNALDATLDDFQIRQGRWSKMDGAKAVKGLIALDQRTAAPNRRSTVATFLELADPLRKYFAKLPQAKAVGLRATDFGFNAGVGRCEECLGIGEIEDGPRWVTCPACGGRRLGPVALSVRDGHGNLAQLLDTPLSDLPPDRAPPLAAVAELLQTIDELGVGHLSLGRRLDTVSGGELQRLRIARELAVHGRGGIMFVLDEPAAGLHHEDVQRLLTALDRIVAGGRNSLVIVEHNLDIVAAADWVIEFGPGSGPRGGQVVAAGPPTQVRDTDTATGRMLSSAGAPAKPTRGAAATKAAGAVDAEGAAEVLRWLRRLLGDDIPPYPSGDLRDILRPTVALSRRDLTASRPLEFGGLARDLAALVLELETRGTSDTTSMVSTWSKNPNAHLQIHPLIQDMYVWGQQIPGSVQRERKRGQAAIGLKWETVERLSDLRATSPRFELPEAAADSERAAVIDEALVLGAGFVELQLGDETLARTQTRAVDLETCVVAPMQSSPLDLLRDDARGRCPTCAGAAAVVQYAERLLIGDENRPVEDPAFLSTDALKVLKGVHRNALSPFFKRMIKEGVWPAQTPLRELSPAQRSIVFHGYWCRPGPGSFLKTPKSKPNEVSSWLRWDGLHTEVRRNTSRGPEAWQRALEDSVEHVTCPECGGTGLRRHAELLEFDGRSYADWMRRGTFGELHEAVQRVPAISKRVGRRKTRLLECLGPFAHSLRELPLAAKLPDADNLEFARHVVGAYTDLPVVEVS